MKTLGRDDLLKPKPVVRERVELPELGGEVWVQGLTTSQRSDFETQFQGAGGKTNSRRMKEIRQRLVVACVCDETGNKLLTVSDVEAIGKQRADIIERLVNVANRLCGNTADDIESLAKNSDGTTGVS